MNHDPRRAIRQALMVARRQAAYGGQQSYPEYRPINPLTGLPEDDAQAGSNDPSTPGPPGAPSTGDFGRDVAGFAEAAGPALGGMAIGGLMGGPAGAVMGGVASTMAQGLAEATGLSNPASAPPGGFASVAANVAETQMGMTPTGNPATAIGAAMTGPANPADQEDADQGNAQSNTANANATDNSNSMSEAATADASADSDGGSNGDSGGAGGNGGGGGGGGFARGGDVKGGMDPRSLPGIHLKTNHRFADGGGVQPEEEEGFDAYHGSPHEFEQFDSSKIGTGEGAQAYGRGLYFAENEGVARSYRDSLSEKTRLFQGKPIGEIEPENELQKAIIHHMLMSNDDPFSAADRFFKNIPRKELLKEGVTPPSWAEVRAARDAINKDFSMTQGLGFMYHVRVNAKPEHFLDWNAPLSEQHPQVVQALDQTFPSAMDYWRSVEGKAGDNGGYFHAVAAEGLSGNTKKSHEQIASKLQSAGVPGIKYFDAGSRDEGKGTRNYVVFDHNLIETKRRYADGGGVQPEENSYMTGKDGKISFDSIPEFLNSRKIPFTVEHSKSMGNFGPSLSSYYKIETSNGKSTIRVSDHDYLPPSNGVDVRYGDLIEGAEARISDHLGIPFSLPAQKAKQKQEEDRLNFLDQENKNRLLNAPKPATIERQKQEQKAYWDRQREIEIRNAEIKKLKEEKKAAKLQRSADGGEIMPQRDLGADPTVQRAMDVTREYQDPPTKHIEDWQWKSERQKDYGLKKGGSVVDAALRMTAPDRPMVALADLFQRQLRGRPPS